MSLLENAWVVGIGGGIVSGIIVYLITSWLFSGQGKRELGRRIAAANREIVLAVRQGIPENTVPTADVLDALTKATARQHALRAEELYGAAEVAQDLIKEVMDSSFISAQTKEDYCKRLAELDKPEPALTDAEQTARATAAQRWTSVRSSMVGFVSAGFAATAFLMTAVLTAYAARNENDVFQVSNTAGAVLLPILATVLGALVVLVFWTLTRLRRERYTQGSFAISSLVTNSVDAKPVKPKRVKPVNPT